MVKKKVKAKLKSVKSVKKAVKARRATPKAIKTIAKKNVTRIAKTKKPSSRIKAAKQATKRNTKEARAVPPAPKRKVSLGRTKLSPLQPEAPRRQLSSAVLRAFEQAVKMFNRRQFAEAKAMFEDLKPRFPNEVEIIARAQTFIQVCDQRLAHTPTLPRNADELYDRGVFALNIGDFTQARTFFEKALRLRPDEPHLLYSLAATHAQTGSHDQAIAYLSRSIQIQPRFRSQALNDSDFSVLRENKQFLALLGLTSPFERLDSRR
ncbi:MAG: tetratricopeptide repeat protein [Blastocatellia bacterium]|nr:tetratricopeptide repeat protein [Blastocatellia bacterium]